MRKILVRGPFLTQSGYGEHARFVLRALRTKEEEFDIYAINVNWGNTNWLWEDNEERVWFDGLIEKTANYLRDAGGTVASTFDMSVQVTIPNEWERLCPRNVGVTAGIETTRVAPQWIEKAKEMDAIVTISEHSKKVYESTSYTAQNKATGATVEDYRVDNVPISVVHYPVKNTKAADVKFDLEMDFNFLTVAQWSARKNLEVTIRWFVEEFIDQEVGLIVKGSLAKNCVYDRLRVSAAIKRLLEPYPQRKCKVYLLHGFLTEEEMTTLYQDDKVKAYLSLSHGEGFGLPMFEAAYNGVPIIAPAWSGYLDFLYMPVKDKKGKVKNKPMFSTVDYTMQRIPKEAVWEGVLQEDSSWCVPEQGPYKMRLREMYKDYGRFKSRADRLKTWVRENFEESAQYEKFIAAIDPQNEFDVENWLDDLEIEEYE